MSHFELDLHRKCIYIKDKILRTSKKITYNEISKNPEVMNCLSGKDSYVIGQLLALNAEENIEVSYHKFNYKLLLLISILFSSLMVISNVLSTKLTIIDGYTVTGAMLVYPITYIFDYIITDIYGYQNARRVIISTMIALILFDIAIAVLIIIPPSPYWHFQKEVHDIFGQMLRTFCSSTIAFVVSFFVSSYIIQKYKVINPKDSLFKRIFISLLFSEISDTGLFCLLAFGGIWPLHSMLEFMFISYFSKITYELMVYPILTKPIISFIKKVEKIDMLDTDTDFSPFKWEVTYNRENNKYKEKDYV